MKRSDWHIAFTYDELLALKDRVATGWENSEKGEESEVFWDALVTKIDLAIIARRNRRSEK